MPFLGTLSEVSTSSDSPLPPPRGLAQELAAQATSGTGPRSLCQAHTAARAAATNAKLPRVAAAIFTAFVAGPARRSARFIDVGLAEVYLQKAVWAVQMRAVPQSQPCHSKCCPCIFIASLRPSPLHVAARPNLRSKGICQYSTKAAGNGSE